MDSCNVYSGGSGFEARLRYRNSCLKNILGFLCPFRLRATHYPQTVHVVCCSQFMIMRYITVLQEEPR
jgi:hypothetical protein